jgi:hypothetical protein
LTGLPWSRELNILWLTQHTPSLRGLPWSRELRPLKDGVFRVNYNIFNSLLQGRSVKDGVFSVNYNIFNSLLQGRPLKDGVFSVNHNMLNILWLTLNTPSLRGFPWSRDLNIL